MNGNAINILGIESSCDETSAAVYSVERKSGRRGRVLSNVIATQKVHEKYGGVVPELASRAHQQNIVPVVEEALKQAGVVKNGLSAVAFTKGPGLLGSLLVGGSFTKGLSLGLKIPMIEVNHLHGHVLAHFINDEPSFPFLCLLVSGGHTQIILVRDYLDLEIIGRSVDDAAGEAFDKTAKIFGLPYPGGPLIDKYAKMGNPEKFRFPHPSIPGLDFSFSGLKTSVLYFVKEKLKEDGDFLNNNINDLCASVQKTIVDILISKIKTAALQSGIREIALGGGVAANSSLRNELARTGEDSGWKIYLPEFQYCTDNAAMIAAAGYFKFLKGQFAEQTFALCPRM